VEQDDAMLRRMGAVLSARGPDGESVTVDGDLRLVFRRLAINDLVGGAQPFRSTDGRFTVVVNGEIYNHAALAARFLPRVRFGSRSDCEVVLHLYRELGTALFAELNGMFAVAVWDDREHKLVLARDRLGIKPLYCAPVGSGLAFASELRALLVDPRVPRSLDWPAFRDVPSLDYPYQRPGGRVISSGVAGVDVVRPGTFSVWQPGRPLTTTRFWDVSASDEPAGTEAEYVERYADLLADSVRLRLMSDVPVGVFLSGGVDSALVAALAARTGAQMEAFTLVEPSVTAAGDPAAARAAAYTIGLPLHEVRVDAEALDATIGLGLDTVEYLVSIMDYPIVDPEILFKHELHRYVAATRPDTKVLLLGQGADEFAGGYSTLTSPTWAGFVGREAAALRRARARDAGVPDVLAPLVTERAAQGASVDVPDHVVPWQAARLGDLAAHGLWHEDRTASASGRECRVPFLDHRIVELLCSVPASLHETLFRDKRIERLVAERVLPAPIANRRKVPLYDTRLATSSIRMLRSRLVQKSFPTFRERYLGADDALFDADRLAELHDHAVRPSAPDAFTDLLLRCMALAVFERSCRMLAEPDTVLPVPRARPVPLRAEVGAVPHAKPTEPVVRGGDLPDINGLARMPDTTWRALGARLHEIGFGPAYCGAMWEGPHDAYPGLQRPVSAWRAQQRDDPAGIVYRLFCLGAAVDERAACQALTRPVFGAALDAGVLVRPGDGIVSAVLDLRISANLYVLCDRLEFGGDAVFGVGEGNSAFQGIVSDRWPTATAVDIGCGAGAAALTAARHARRVVATDVNKRALALTHINASLNGMDTIEVREGDLFEPLRGGRFDLLIAQPPFVPQPPDEPDVTYQFGGPSGGDILRHLLGRVGAHLTDGGRAAVVYEAPVARDGTDRDPWLDIPVEPDLHGLRLVGSPVGADVYATRYALPRLRSGASEFDAAALRMRSHLSDLGIAAIRPAVGVFERVPGSTGWKETVAVDGALWDGIGSTSVWRLLRGVSAVRAGAQDVAVGLPAGALVVELLDGDPNEVYLGLPPGYLGRTRSWTREDLAALRTGDVRDAALRERALRAGFLRDDGGTLW
jgi:asparagine synthase (glutamine-hydrolysing)